MAAISSHANTQRRCLPKYSYFSRLSGGRGRYIPCGCAAAEGSVAGTIPPVSPGWRRLPRCPDGEPTSTSHDVVATRAAHVRGDLPVGSRSVPEVEDHEGKVMAADRRLVGRCSWTCPWV